MLGSDHDRLGVKRRRRPAVSCSLCRRRKIRCNREQPCSNCIKSGNENCDFEENAPLRQHRVESARSQASPNSTASVGAASAGHHGASSVASSVPDPWMVETHPDIVSMRQKIQQLEEQMSHTNAAPPPFYMRSGEAGRSIVESAPIARSQGTIDLGFFGDALNLPRSIAHKTRLFGQSHWIHGGTLVRDIAEIMQPHIKDESSPGFRGMQKCKSLSRVLKSRWTPAWPCPLTPDLPSKDLADELIDCYLRSTESVYRILHIPTFRNDYEAIWTSTSQANKLFLVQLKLVFAIGAVTYDDRFSLRASAIRWVYEAQTILSEPTFKHRLTIQGIQCDILLLMAREAANVQGDLVWISAGALLRNAVYMGLHRDPIHLPKQSTVTAEMRRRLWNTIMELNLQASLMSGGPVLMSPEHFDTQPPGNFDDEQLATGPPMPKPEDVFTQTSIPIAFRQTFLVRLAVVAFLNDLKSRGSYEDMLRLDAEFRAAYKVLRQDLQRFHSTVGDLRTRSDVRILDLVMNRYLVSLHVPFYGPSLSQTAFAYSRKVAVETSLKVWYAACPPSPPLNSQESSQILLPNQTDLVRAARSSSGIYRAAVFWAAILIGAELKTQLQEDDCIGSLPLRTDLLSVITTAKRWALETVEAGETNVKGYVLISLVAAQINGLMNGVGKEEMAPLLVKAAEQAEEDCISIMERMAAIAAQGQDEQPLEGFDQMSLSMPSEMMEDWDFSLFDFPLSSGDATSVNWASNTAPFIPLAGGPQL